MRGRRLALLVAGTLAIVTAATAPGFGLPGRSGLRGSGNGAGLEQESQSLRQQAYLRLHEDANGNVRPGLWRRGLRQFDRIPTSATWPTRKGVSGRIVASPRLASQFANPVVQGVRWKQIGPAPLRIDAGGGNCGGGLTCNKLFQGNGPDSGEVTDIAIDPRGTTDKTVYITTNDGGVWKTTNGGASWAALTDGLDSLSMGAIAIDPINRQIVYAATGNGYDGSCNFTKGIGLYKSIDAGSTWSQIGGVLFKNAMINRIQVLAGNVLLVATNKGLYRSVDGGSSFGANAPTFNDTNAIVLGNATDLDIDTANPNTVYVSMASNDRCSRLDPGGSVGVRVSTDAGATFPTNLFTNTFTNAPAPLLSSFIRFAQGTSVSSTFYAAVAKSGSGWRGLFKSTNSGSSWTRMAAADTPAAASGASGCQCDYDLTLGVDPLDAKRVYLGFQELWLSTDGAASFAGTQISRGQTHWDHHALTFSPSSHVSSTSAVTSLWVGNDGGVARSKDGGTTWDLLDESIATNLFNGIDIGRGAANNGWTYGGGQDTGTSQHAPTDTGNDWHLGVDGDGGVVTIDPNNPQHVVGVDDGSLIVTTNGGASWTTPSPSGLGATKLYRVKFDPSNNQNLWVSDDGGSNGFQPGPNLYRSTNGGAAFTLLNTFGANVTAIQVDPNNQNNVWIGLDSGVVQSITNALGVTPTFNLLGNPDPATRPTPAPVSSIAVDPSDNSGQTVVVTYEGFSATAAGLRTQHAYRTTDGGQNWTDISGTDGQANTNLPDLPTHSVVIDPTTVPSSIIVSDDAGVLRSLDTGATWQALGTGLPNVDSTSLAIDTTVTPSVLRVGTYGRSVFTLASATGPVLDVKGDLAFGEVQTGKSDTRTVQLYDVGTTDLHLSAFSLTSGSSAFSIVSGATSFPVTITPGAHKDWTVKYAPTAAANDTAQFTAPSDDPSTPAQIPASGSGVASTGGGDNNTDDCAKRYVAQGDGVVVGTDIGNDSGNQHDRYSDKLLKDDLQTITGLTTGTVWCLYNTATDPASTDSFIQGSNSQQSQAWNMKPDLITLQLGRQNNSIVDQVDKCFKNVKDHDFAEANTCALAVFGNTTAWQKLTKDLGGILNAYKTQMAGNPTMVVAVLGYYNPYPTATSVATKIPAFCNQLVDTIPTCIARWILLPPALVTLDQVVKKLNSTISAVVQNFIVASQGRFFFINPYDKFKDHCMTMKVTIKTTVYHPTNDPDHHDTDETDFGCTKNWVVSDGNDGTKSPFPYLTPATDGLLLLATQTTKEMGINPNKKGHMCLEQLIWETVKNKLGVPQKADLANACSSL